MRIFAFALAILCVVLLESAFAQESKPKSQKKDGLPDVSLDIPEETRAEVKAIIKDKALRLFDKRPSERVKAAEVLGELGEQGKPVRGLLCRAMLDSVVDVRVAAADALKSIDPKMQYLAVALLSDESQHPDLLKKIAKLEDDGAPLTPLIARKTIEAAAAGDNGGLMQLLPVLSSIAKNDPRACGLVASALDNKDSSVRYRALKALPPMKHAKLAVNKIIMLLKADVPLNRVAAIEALTTLVDDSTEEIVAKAITSQRYHNVESVRKAVEVALNKLENREK